MSPFKWLPVVDPDECNGCGACLDACTPDCLEIDDTAVVLARPDACGSDEHCIAPCPVEAIRMAWIPCAGDPAVGRWLADRESGVPAGAPGA